MMSRALSIQYRLVGHAFRRRGLFAVVSGPVDIMTPLFSPFEAYPQPGQPWANSAICPALLQREQRTPRNERLQLGHVSVSPGTSAPQASQKNRLLIEATGREKILESGCRSSLKNHRRHSVNPSPYRRS